MPTHRCEIRAEAPARPRPGGVDYIESLMNR